MCVHLYIYVLLRETKITCKIIKIRKEHSFFETKWNECRYKRVESSTGGFSLTPITAFFVMNTSESIVNLSRFNLLEYTMPCRFVYWNECKFHDVNIICPTNDRNPSYFALFNLTRKGEIQLIKADSLNKFLVYIYVLSTTHLPTLKCASTISFFNVSMCSLRNKTENFKTGIFPEWKKEANIFQSKRLLVMGLFMECFQFVACRVHFEIREDFIS